MRKAREPVCKLSDLAENLGKVVPLGNDGGECAIFKINGSVFATGSLCPHQNSSLDNAPVECGSIVCQRHGFRFDPKTGDCLTIGGYGLPVYEVDVEDETVFVSFWIFED
jgi:nitrite reductase/ring-hydroxylating ferredoxin subunit